MSKERIKRIRREWGQWKRYNLSKRERNNIEIGMFIDFACSKGHSIKGLFEN